MRINQLKDVSALLKSRRKTMMLSQAELGSRIGLSQERVSAIENHPEKVTLDNLFTYLMALGIKLDLSVDTPKRGIIFRGGKLGTEIDRERLSSTHFTFNIGKRPTKIKDE